MEAPLSGSAGLMSVRSWGEERASVLGAMRVREEGASVCGLGEVGAGVRGFWCRSS
ncbi:uncharacterized protein CMC5_060870 [Chondromyces crocatus]|uniref:Uncharacterized protein n=1 Tax=Chondromyces crocatus TaxID=52 RepID=A0A0K1EM25_CHOCO|nr:uncharacterized protein CMC5_060870 [Chondromyces crocatus]